MANSAFWMPRRRTTRAAYPGPKSDLRATLEFERRG
jgi:hypothetical protein